MDALPGSALPKELLEAADDDARARFEGALAALVTAGVVEHALRCAAAPAARSPTAEPAPARGVSKLHAWVDGLAYSSLAVEVTPELGTPLAKMINCDISSTPGSWKAESGTALRFERATTRTSLLEVTVRLVNESLPSMTSRTSTVRTSSMLV